MDAQSKLPGLGQAGLLHEMNFNYLLADALRRKRKAWREDPQTVTVERTQVVEGAKRERPDLLVSAPDAYPVAIETEWDKPAVDDAKNRLGKRMGVSALPVRSAVAVGAPSEIRAWPDEELAAQMDELQLRFVVLTASVTGETDVALHEEDIAVWPAQHYVTGTIDDLACLCEYATAPPELVSRFAEQVAERIDLVGGALHQQLSPSVARAMADGLGQHDTAQGVRLACCIWLTSLRLQTLLAERSPSLREQGLRSVPQLRISGLGDTIVVSELRREWAKILEVNYGAIFQTARDALHIQLPTAAGATLNDLSDLAERISTLRLGNRVEFAGELFPKLLADRKETAANYTLPETAELLASLAVERLQLPDWADSSAVAGLRVADMACGTGTLLRAACQNIRRRHEAAGGSAGGLHQTMMEESITGLDINAHAAHMTAAALSSNELGSEYHKSNIGLAAVIGGKTGSLELIESDQLTDITGEGAASAAKARQGSVNIVVPHGSQDLVIQNPPYSRTRGGRKAFDVAGISEAQRENSVNRLNGIRGRLHKAGDEMANGKAGFGSDFSALADKKLKPGGVLATVLPLTAAHAESWEGFRRSIETGYERITAISFTGHASAMMSADTHMNEMLLVATKRTEPKTDAEAAVVTCVNLSRPPQSLAEAFWHGKHVAGISGVEGCSGFLNEGDRIGIRIGNWIRIKVPPVGFPWFPLGMQSHTISATAASLLDGEFYSVRDERHWKLNLDLTSLGGIVNVGPTHHLVGHRRGYQPIGAFEFLPVQPGELPDHPSLWAANGATQTRIKTRPTHSGFPVTGRQEQAKRMLDARSDLFISRNLRMTSQALAAATTSEPVMGGNAWTALLSDDDGVKSALAIWLNSTLGAMIITGYGQTTQPGRALMKIRALRGLPVPNFAADSPAGEHARSVAQERFAELAELELEPLAYAFRDANRRRIDAAALDMLGLGGDPDAARALDHLRNVWCREPSVHGDTSDITRALGIE